MAASSEVASGQRYCVTVEQSVRFRRDGYLVVPGLIGAEEVAELRRHTEDLMQGKLPEQTMEAENKDTFKYRGTVRPGLEAPPRHLSPEEKARFFLRIHMLHRKLPLHERFLLHPRVLDVLEALIGPDVMALQSMLFLKPPGKPGQGWHQDSYYIVTIPDSLCAAWMAVDDCDEYNGALWMAKGSQHEPVYPPKKGILGFGDEGLRGLEEVGGVSDPDDAKNDLTQIAGRYDQVLISAKAGDVVFFGGHILHRSRSNTTQDRFRRAFVGHYCNARSFTQYGLHLPNDHVQHAPVVDPVTKMTNGSHILARGRTHLPFARPMFGDGC